MIKDRMFLKKAREQLDADHYGLDKIKRRLIEYLAVVRLKQLAAEAEQIKEAQLEQSAEAVSQEIVVRGEQRTPSPVLPPRPRARNTVKGPILL